MSRRDTDGRETVLGRLSRSHRYTVVAQDGVAGTVETPLFPPDGDGPDYVVARVVAARGRSELRILPVALVEDVEPEKQVIRVRLTSDELLALPARLPLER